MSHAIIKSGGKQFVVEEGQIVRVPSLTADAGSSIELDALFNSNGDGKSSGKISATVVDHGRDQKVVVDFGGEQRAVESGEIAFER